MSKNIVPQLSKYKLCNFQLNDYKIFSIVSFLTFNTMNKNNQFPIQNTRKTTKHFQFLKQNKHKTLIFSNKKTQKTLKATAH